MNFCVKKFLVGLLATACLSVVGCGTVRNTMEWVLEPWFLFVNLPLFCVHLVLFCVQITFVMPKHLGLVTFVLCSADLCSVFNYFLFSV